MHTTNIALAHKHFITLTNKWFNLGSLETLSLYPQTMDSTNNIRDISTTGVSPSMQNTASSSSHSSMIPTQQQLQEIYEENLRMREEAKSAFNQSPQALLSSGASSGPESQTLASQRQQFLEDERVALMLQNEEFMAELR